MKDIIDLAVQKLDRITESFPAYTLHNHKHSENVIKNIENFLKDRIQDLTDVELIVLILSAYLHDIGMYYNREEVNEIEKSDEFINYLDEHPTEYLKYKNSTKHFLDVINETHNDNVRSIIDNPNLNPRLGYESDMKFCAVLLRLADYTDFDGYQYNNEKFFP